MPRAPKALLGDLLMAKGLLTERELDAAMAWHRKLGVRLGVVLTEYGGRGLGFPRLTAHQIDDAIAHQSHERAPRWRIGRRVLAALRSLRAADASMREAGAACAAGAGHARSITLGGDE